MLLLADLERRRVAVLPDVNLGVFVDAYDVRSVRLVLQLLDDRPYVARVDGLVEVEIHLPPHLPERGEAQRAGDEGVGNGKGDVRGTPGPGPEVLHLHPQESWTPNAPADVARDDGRVEEEEERKQEESIDDGLGFLADGLFHVSLPLQRQERGPAAKGSRRPGMDIPGPRC